MTALLAAGLVGGLGLAAFSQQTPEGGSEHHGRGHRPDLTATAAQLGVSEADLKAALGLPAERPERPDLATAAAQLGVSETDLREAMVSAREAVREQRQAAGAEGDPQRGGRGDALASVATQLGVSEVDLQTALGLPAERPERPDLATAAAQLGISETELQEALRNNMPPSPEPGQQPAQ
ncbi:hypothetical protein IQ254_22295 [Nodosilinea sp. LEGE 07088]|uniref:hypothetical protein n=1 Tax=Nodosilinea sp. LEGE 07088 TaxID=2777968 RepID=UPI00187DDB89|nr:hypothetical protein [Nodosilinea sp. LEGE 07088]MBE9139892.1 hypothetical protein [Nodosilinea sp. LEGE 07088]